MRGTLRYYEELKKENPIKSRQLVVYESTAGRSVKLPEISKTKQNKSSTNRPDFVLDCNQPGAKLRLYDTLRDKYLKGFFINIGVQDSMRKTGMLDEGGNVIDFHSKPIKRVPMRELIEGSITQRIEPSTIPARKSSTIEYTGHQRSKSNPKNTVNGVISNESYKPSKAKLTPLSNEELRQIIQKQKEKALKEMTDENKSDHSKLYSDKISEPKIEEPFSKNEETSQVMEYSVDVNEKSAEKEKNEEETNHENKGEDENKNVEDRELDKKSNENDESQNKTNMQEAGFFVTQDHVDESN